MWNSSNVGTPWPGHMESCLSKAGHLASHSTTRCPPSEEVVQVHYVKILPLSVGAQLSPDACVTASVPVRTPTP